MPKNKIETQAIIAFFGIFCCKFLIGNKLIAEEKMQDIMSIIEEAAYKINIEQCPKLVRYFCSIKNNKDNRKKKAAIYRMISHISVNHEDDIQESTITLVQFISEYSELSESLIEYDLIRESSIDVQYAYKIINKLVLTREEKLEVESMICDLCKIPPRHPACMTYEDTAALLGLASGMDKTNNTTPNRVEAEPEMPAMFYPIKPKVPTIFNKINATDFSKNSPSASYNSSQTCTTHKRKLEISENTIFSEIKKALLRKIATNSEIPTITLD